MQRRSVLKVSLMQQESGHEVRVPTVMDKQQLTVKISVRK